MVLCIVQARMGSTRLPGKVMKDISSKNKIIDSVVEQLKFSTQIKKIIVAIPNLVEDDILYDYLASKSISTFRGSSNNVLDRYYQAAKNESYSTIVRITADCPLIDPSIVDQVIKKFLENKFDYVANTHPRTYPYGTETEVFSFKALEKAWKETNDDFDQEHVTPYFYNNVNQFKIGNLSQEHDQSNYRWTVDYPEDLEFVKIIVENIKKRPILKDDIINFILTKPEITKINEDRNVKGEK